MPAIGFGAVAFSTGQYGIADWAEEELWKTIPLIYRELDKSDQNNFLRKTVNGYKPPFNELRRYIDKIPKQADPRECDLNMLNLLGANFFVKPDDFKPDLFRRSAVIHIVQQLLLKGQDKGYKVLAAIEGYYIDIERFNETECESGVLTTDPPVFIPDFDETPPDFYGYEVNEFLVAGDGFAGPFAGNFRKQGVLASSITITTVTSGMTVTDDGSGTLVGDVNVGFPRAVDYDAGSFVFTFSGPTVAGERIQVTYTWTVQTDIDWEDEFGLWDRRETYFPAPATASLTLANDNSIRYVHLFRNGLPLLQGPAPAGQFQFDGVDTLTLTVPSVAGDEYQVQIVDGFKLHNSLDPNPRCRSHSLKGTITLGPFMGWVTPLATFVDRLQNKVKPIHVTFEELVYVVAMPTVFTPTSVSLQNVKTCLMTVEEEHLFDVSAADVEPTDGGLTVDLE